MRDCVPPDPPHATLHAPSPPVPLPLLSPRSSLPPPHCLPCWLPLPLPPHPFMRCAQPPYHLKQKSCGERLPPARTPGVRDPPLIRCNRSPATMLLTSQTYPGTGTALGCPATPLSQMENRGPGRLNTWPTGTGSRGTNGLYFYPGVVWAPHHAVGWHLGQKSCVFLRHRPMLLSPLRQT